VIRNRL